MKLKNPSGGLLFIINTIVIIFFPIFVFFLIFGIPVRISSYDKINPPTNIQNLVNNDSIDSKKEIIAGYPVRIKITKINVDAAIKDVGLTPDGAMDVSKGPYDVAWYKLGPRPGEKGSAVIAGHYGRWKNGATSVFNKLNTLVAGDKISIEDNQGTITFFIVRESKTYPLDAVATEVFYSNDGKSHLNLITCIQDKITKKYDNRLVVFTDKEIITDLK